MSRLGREIAVERAGIAEDRRSTNPVELAWEDWYQAKADARNRRLQDELAVERLFADAMKLTVAILADGIHQAKQVDDRYLLTVRQVAEVLGCSERHVRTLIQNGDLPAVRPGGVLRVKPGDLDQYIREHSSGSWRPTLEKRGGDGESDCHPGS